MKPKPTDYSTRWKEAYYKIEAGKTKVIDFLPVFEFAYRKLAGSGGN